MAEAFAQILHILEMSFLENFKTDNIILDTLLKGFIITVTTALFFKLKNLISNWHHYFERFVSLLGWRTSKLTFKWKICKSAQAELNSESKNFEAILHQVMQLNFDDAGVCNFLENPNAESKSYIVNQNLPFKFEPGVYGRITSDPNKNDWGKYEEGVGGRGMVISDTFCAEIFSRTKSMNYLTQLVDKWVEEFEEFGLKTNKVIVKWRVNQKRDNDKKPMKSFESDKKESQAAGMEARNDSKRFEAILHQVMKLDYDEAGISTLREIPESLSFMVAQEPPFEFSPGVFGKIHHDKIVGQREMEYCGEIFNAEIYSQTKSLRELQNLIEEWVEEYESYERQIGWNELKFYGRMKQGRQFNFSVKLLSILHHLEKKGSTNPSIKVLKEFAVEEEKQFGREEEVQAQKREQLIPETIEVEKDVFCQVTCGAWGNGKGGSQDPSEVQVRVYSKKLNVSDLVALVKQWEKIYEEFNELGKGLRYFVFNPPPVDQRSNSGLQTNYTEFAFESGKTFNNIFFPEKEKLIKKIQFFNNNESWYMKHGTPYMFGLLLHGEPGCGKTSTIKAIANMTKRHIVSVPLKNVKTISDLYNALYGGKINKTSIPMNKRLYVLEDIDCAGLDDIMKKRSAPKETSESKPSESVKESNSDEKKNEEKDKPSEPPVNTTEKTSEIKLSDLLEAFDGVLEMKGRMMVMTTNHLEKLDPALIRPGRVDLSLEFKRCNKKAIGDFFETFFPGNNLDVKNVEDGVWTPAEVAQICINHQDDVELAIQKIYERKTIPKEKSFDQGLNNEIMMEDLEIMSESGSDFTDTGISDISD